MVQKRSFVEFARSSVAAQKDLANARPLVGECWLDCLDTLARETNDKFDEEEQHRAIYSRGDITCDPLRDHRQSSGDARMQKLLATLDGFGVDRSREQRAFHTWFIQAAIPHIYREEWGAHSSAILKRYDMKRVQAEVMCLTPRRFGKTWSVAMYVAAMLLCVPGLTIAVFSRAIRQSSDMAKWVLKFIAKIPGGSARLVRQSKEIISVATAAASTGGKRTEKDRKIRLSEADTSHLYSYPGSVDSKYFVQSEVREQRGVGGGCLFSNRTRQAIAHSR